MPTKVRQTKAQKEAAFAKATKLWQILRIALHDLAECERSKACEIEMNAWYEKSRTRCCVCLAGSVMRQRLKPDRRCRDDFTLVPGSYSGDQFTCKLEALNYLRCGEVSYAASMMDIYEFNVPDRHVIHYHVDRHLWWKQIKMILADLKRAGI